MCGSSQVVESSPLFACLISLHQAMTCRGEAQSTPVESCDLVRLHSMSAQAEYRDRMVSRELSSLQEEAGATKQVCCVPFTSCWTSGV